MENYLLRYRKTLFLLGIGSILAILAYLCLFMNMNYAAYFLSLRVPKVLVMVIVAFAIGGASIVFQSIIQNTIVTPCLLGMNSLYSLIHTGVVFFLGSGSVLIANANVSFAIDVVLMGIIATVIYSYLFRKTKHNVLYVLLTGTILTTLFTSIQTTLTRIMDPNEYDSLLASLVASFNNINTNIILFSVLLMGAVVFFLRKELGLLDVISLGKTQAINLGVDYDKTIRRLLLGVTLFIAIATALVGPISFLGLIIANLSREVFITYRHSYLILGSCLIGTIILIAGQILVEHVYNFSMPISVFITVGGGIYFLYLLMRQRRA
ncbi:iron chelate uptake ABC transporter family permease subunit [Amedibacterium intestinale]|uniref:iron chelate uptake ABC transporter family permease subunit n=1 Tax=Amedibacterium intestinale TaxID=2583452 RepID=UPI000E52C3D2|nr:iron chelate uptake ABC transporter family permease subunit [Amedibacterium intestinale]RHO20111.1 CRISPR-associated protein Cas5 [Eubacterium sp. AM18-26]RHO23754.1 CRISPR-associated protein Cas5 [Eubacterium sp. AM18-10LB-B]